MRTINLIVIHCSASRDDDSLYRGSVGTPGFLNPAQVIDAWHHAPPHEFQRTDDWRQRQNPDLAAIGYHYVIGRDGTVFTGRHVDEVGAHAKGYNQRSIGICLVGLEAFSAAQWDTLAHLVTAEVARITGYNSPANRSNPLSRASAARQRDILICGHRDLPNVHKTCPGFDVEQWLTLGMPS
ncbi:MAG: N-acetylmuramoyl-L-alanine amidase [Dechloromonas sp.]|nr:N-acetylmuramoyl-L-alanine amidase [Dechloromonas sp.]